MDGPTRNQRDAKEKASDVYVMYATEAFFRNDDLHQATRDADLSIQCNPPEEFAQESGFTRLKYACGKCSNCPGYKRPGAEVIANDAIKYYCYRTLPTYSKCGALPDGTKTCQFHQKAQKEERGTEIESPSCH